MLAALLNFLESRLVGHIMGMDKATEPWAEKNHGPIEKALHELANVKK